MFESASVHNLPVVSSDHTALFLDVQGAPQTSRYPHKHFKFENAWLADEGCKQVVIQAWQDGGHVDIQGKLSLCASRLSKWGGEKFNNFGRTIYGLKKKLAKLKPRRDVISIAEYDRLHSELNHCMNQEEIYWKQRAKQFWLKEGDMNTKFFHRYASARKQKNQILKLKDSVGSWVEGDNMRSVIYKYYVNIYKSAGTQEVDFVDGIQKKVTEAQNSLLLKPFESEEVKEAIFSMHPDKALGPDGMNLDSTNISGTT